MSSSADSTKLEKLVLAGVLRALDKNPPQFTKAGWDVLLYAAQGLLIAFAYNWLTSKHQGAAWFQWVSAALPFLIGAFLVYIVLWSFMKSQWFFLKPFINRAALEDRLRELGP